MKRQLALASIILTSAAAATAAPFANGSFEMGADPGVATTLAAGSTDLSPWVIGGGGLDYISGYWTASDGSRSVELNGPTAGSISQTIDTVVGETYTVTFNLSGNPDAAPAVKTVVVWASPGGAPQTYTFDTAAAGNTTTDMKWATNTYTFVATATSTTVTFTSTTEGPAGPVLDNITITSTPAEVEDCPDAPSIAAKYLKSLGVKPGGKGMKNIIAQVAHAMGPGTDFDGISECEEGYEEAVQDFIDELLHHQSQSQSPAQKKRAN